MQTPIALKFEPNFDTASVYVEYTSMPNTRVRGTIRYRTSGRDWMIGHALVDLPRNPLVPAIPPTLATSLFGLISSEQVEVEITFIRESTIDSTVLRHGRRSPPRRASRRRPIRQLYDAPARHLPHRHAHAAPDPRHHAATNAALAGLRRDLRREQHPKMPTRDS
jgi:hypothetical protein